MSIKGFEVLLSLGAAEEILTGTHDHQFLEQVFLAAGAYLGVLLVLLLAFYFSPS